jgi:hypothetical protein
VVGFAGADPDALATAGDDALGADADGPADDAAGGAAGGGGAADGVQPRASDRPTTTVRFFTDPNVDEVAATG